MQRIIILFGLIFVLNGIDLSNSCSGGCTPDKSVGQCERCLDKDQCKDGFCCPFMKLCVPTSSTRCPANLAANCRPSCFDNMDQNLCNCTNTDFPAEWPMPTC